MPEITPATAVGVTATAKILGVELTAQGDALLAQGISNLKPRDKSIKKANDSKYTKREMNEAKRAFSTNDEFRRYFHREYKPAEVQPINGKNNPDLTDEQITEAYKEWLKYYGNE